MMPESITANGDKMFDEEAESITKYIKFISNFIRSGIDEMVQLGNLIPVEHGFCFACQQEKPVYDVAPRFPTQPAICDHCLFQKGLLMLSDPEKVQELVNNLKNR